VPTASPATTTLEVAKRGAECRVTAVSKQALTGVQIPYPERAVERTRDDMTTVFRHTEGCDLIGVDLKRESCSHTLSEQSTEAETSCPSTVIAQARTLLA